MPRPSCRGSTREHEAAEDEKQVDEQVEREIVRLVEDLRSVEVAVGDAQRGDSAQAVQRLEARPRNRYLGRRSADDR